MVECDNYGVGKITYNSHKYQYGAYIWQADVILILTR